MVAHDIYVMAEGKEIVYESKESLLREYNLQGKVVEIELASLLADEAWAHLRMVFPNLRREISGGVETIGLSSHSQQEKLDFVSLLDRLGYGIEHIRYRRPTLEEVFLTLTEKNTA